VLDNITGEHVRPITAHAGAAWPAEGRPLLHCSHTASTATPSMGVHPLTRVRSTSPASPHACPADMQENGGGPGAAGHAQHVHQKCPVVPRAAPCAWTVTCRVRSVTMCVRVCAHVSHPWSKLVAMSCHAPCHSHRPVRPACVHRGNGTCVHMHRTPLSVTGIHMPCIF